ncbi:endo-1,3;1,4-beta-D-glucanase-like [Lycium ferocissimum]|uniref:endo-1,3;1,4-beta-D-glucanase-like n=1 Tax=Lycium ferocissimum TaxID=112874 RepID=UPI00281685CE|nr:endo-1,3;1,4-beta-D-glucanase-like [Lycium ferocissimum]
MSGPQCCENPPALSSSTGHGSVLELGGLKTYVSGSSNSKQAILLVSDIFGYEAPNLRMLADKVAAGGYYVVVPDFLYGDPYNPENTEKPIPVWLQSHGPDKGFEDAKQVIAALKDKGISAIGAAGFCWGAKVVVQLAKSDNIQAAVLLHPSFVSVDDIKQVKTPIAILGAEIDKMSPPELCKQFEEILSSKPEVECFVKVYPGVAHGWTVRYNVEDKKAVQSAEEAHQDMLDWFTKHVK